MSTDGRELAVIDAGGGKVAVLHDGDRYISRDEARWLWRGLAAHRAGDAAEAERCWREADEARARGVELPFLEAGRTSAMSKLVPALADLGPVRGATARRWYWYRDKFRREWHPSSVDGYRDSHGQEWIYVIEFGSTASTPVRTAIERDEAEFAPMAPPPAEEDNR